MKIAIDAFGCDHSKSGWGSYLFYFVKNIPADYEDDFELFGSEIDRYTYKSEKEYKYVSVNIPDNLRAEQRWHRHKNVAFVNKNNYDLVIYPAVERVIPKKFQKNSIAVMNSIFSTIKETSRRKIRRQVKKGLENVSLIIAPSKFIKDDLVKNGIDEKKIHVIYNGIDHKMFYPILDNGTEFVEIKPFAIKRPYFIYGSRLSGEEKKHLQLIEAFNIFKKKTGAPHRLVLAGSDGDFSEQIKKAAYDSEFASDIFITGYFPHESFPKLYANSTACVFPSVNEGVGLPILEAMACGIPVLCSNSGALMEVGGDAPIYFDSNNVNEIAEDLEKIISDEVLYKQKVDAGLERANHFNWEETVMQTLEYAQQLLKK